ncbi:hypothetical protein MMC31_006270 [Peltigera leucophlebia]|nr:hypothetical protein [Peltigera leucophlebia]
MTEFAPHKGRFEDGGYLPELFGAHLLGDIGGSYNFSMLPDYPLAGTPWASNPASFWNATDHWEYIFLDSAPLTRFLGPSFLSIHTDRIVKSSAICKTPPYAITIRDSLAVIKLVDTNQTVEFPKIALGLESTYYLTRPAISGRTTTSISTTTTNGIARSTYWGPPAPESFVNKLQPGYLFYHCNITAESNDTRNQQQQLRPQTAAVAEQAIALSGRIHSELKNRTLSNNQYFTYNFGLPFGEPQNNSAAGMAELLSRFAIGVIAATAQTNPPITIPGQTPKQGIRLKLNAPVAFYLILALIAGIQLVLIIFNAVVVSPIKIPDEIPWSHQERIQSRFVRN